MHFDCVYVILKIDLENIVITDFGLSGNKGIDFDFLEF